MTPLRVLLVDDHALVRGGIRALVEKMADIVVVGEAGTGEETLELLPLLTPDVVLLDISMPGIGGLETAARMARDFPAIKVILVSMHANPEYAAQAIRVGAAGYLQKDAATGELEAALRAVAAGKNYLSPAHSAYVLDRMWRRGPSAPRPAALTLSPRQREVLQRLAMGESTKEIAFALELSPKTVETHRAQVMARLNLHDVVGLVKYALRERLIPPEE